MKYIKIFMATVVMALLTASCDQDLPYPLDDVKNGVVIDIIRVEAPMVYFLPEQLMVTTK